MENTKNYPEKCPVTGRHFFAEIKDEHGELVPTYSDNPFDSYTIPYKSDNDETWYCDRFDHEVGAWIGTENVEEDLILEIVENKKAKEIEKFIEKIANGRHRTVNVPSSLISELAEKMEAKYWGTVTFFAFGEMAHVKRDSKEPMKLKSEFSVDK